MEKTKTDYALMMQDIKKYVESQFENPKSSIPRLAQGLIELEKRQTEYISKHEGLEKRVDSAESKTTDDAISGIKKSLTKIYGKIGFNAFLDYLQTSEGKDLLKQIFEGNKDVLTEELAKIATEKGGIVSKIGGKFRKYLFTAAGIEAIVMMATVGVGVMYVANKTPVGKFIVDQKRAESLLKEVNTYKSEQTMRLKSAFESINQTKSEMEEIKKRYESQLSSIKSSIDSYSKSNEENLKKIENLEKSREEEKKKREDLEKKIKEVEKKNSGSGFIKKLNPLK
ncbi:MAG: hypothetical protein V1660_03025 [archaeon]